MSPYSPRDVDRSVSAPSRRASTPGDPLGAAMRAELDHGLTAWHRARAAQDAATAPVTAPPPAEAPTDPVDVSGALRALAAPLLTVVVEFAPTADPAPSGTSALNSGVVGLQGDYGSSAHATTTSD